MNDDYLSGIMKAFDMFERFRSALADEAAAEVSKIGGDGEQASVSILHFTSNPNSWVLTPRQRSMSLLDKAARMASSMPLRLRDGFNAVEFYHRQDDKFNLIRGLGRALVAIEHGATSVAYLMGHVHPQGPLSETAKTRVVVAGPTTLAAYLLARYVRELRQMPVDEFVDLLVKSNVTGQPFYFMSDERTTLTMDPDVLADATRQGFAIGHELALGEPSLDAQSSAAQLRLTPTQVKQLAFNSQRSFEPFNIEQELQHGRHSAQSNDLDQIHHDRASTGPAPRIEASRGPLLPVDGQGTT